MKLAEEIDCSSRVALDLSVILCAVQMRARQNQSLVIVPCVGIQAARKLISSWLVNIVIPLRMRVVCQNLWGSNVIAPHVIWYVCVNFAHLVSLLIYAGLAALVSVQRFVQNAWLYTS